MNVDVVLDNGLGREPSTCFRDSARMAQTELVQRGDDFILADGQRAYDFVTSYHTPDEKTISTLIQ